MSKSKWLTLEERKAIEEMYNNNTKVAEIAEAFHRNVTTIYLELRNGSTGEMDRNGRAGYSAEIAQKRIFELKMKRRQQV